MVSFLSACTALLVLGGQYVSASKLNRRAENFSLYAYGTNITAGLRVFYGDGKAYIGNRAPDNVSDAVNITFSSSGGTFIIAPDASSGITWELDPKLFINNSTDAFDTVGFVNSNETLATGEVSSGFGLYGAWAYHSTPSGDIEMKFYATATNETDIYLIKWNAATTQVSDGIPIALRTTAPTTITE